MGRTAKDDFQLNGLLDRGCSFEGKLTFDGTVQINGDFKGEILSDGTLVIGSDAHVNARIQVNTLVIDGNVQGLVEAKGKIELRRGGKLIANIVTPSLAIEEGALFQGQCQMQDEERPNTDKQTSIHENPLITSEGDDALMM